MYFGVPIHFAGEGQFTDSSRGAAKQSRTGTLPYREALEETERKQREEYQRDCANVTVLQTLERESFTPRERVKRLERKLAALPRIVQGHKLIRELIARRRAGGFPTPNCGRL